MSITVYIYIIYIINKYRRRSAPGSSIDRRAGHKKLNATKWHHSGLSHSAARSSATILFFGTSHIWAPGNPQRHILGWKHPNTVVRGIKPRHCLHHALLVAQSPAPVPALPQKTSGHLSGRHLASAFSNTPLIMHQSMRKQSKPTMVYARRNVDYQDEANRGHCSGLVHIDH